MITKTFVITVIISSSSSKNFCFLYFFENHLFSDSLHATSSVFDKRQNEILYQLMDSPSLDENTWSLGGICATKEEVLPNLDRLYNEILGRVCKTQHNLLGTHNWKRTILWVWKNTPSYIWFNGIRSSRTSKYRSL